MRDCVASWRCGVVERGAKVMWGEVTTQSIFVARKAASHAPSERLSRLHLIVLYRQTLICNP